MWWGRYGKDHRKEWISSSDTAKGDRSYDSHRIITVPKPDVAAVIITASSA